MITPRQLTEAYMRLYPHEFFRTPGQTPVDLPDLDRTFGNWLAKPRVAMSNWCGKVTRAFFAAHNQSPPKNLPAAEAFVTAQTK